LRQGILLAGPGFLSLGIFCRSLPWQLKNIAADRTAQFCPWFGKRIWQIKSA
jgi:hypothetical protein